MPRLTGQEKQDLIRFLEADKPLPDKYRFLLFEEKREVELGWNGKTSEFGVDLVTGKHATEVFSLPTESTRSLIESV